MCRQLFTIISREAISTLIQLLNAYRKAVWYDPLLEKIRGVRSHCEGVGVVIASATNGSWRIYYERFDANEYAGDSCMVNLSALDAIIERVREIVVGGGWDRLVVMMHSRRASRGEPRGTLYAHPFHYSVIGSHGAIDLFFSHNGGVDKNQLANTLNIRGPLNVYSDSFLAGLFLSNMLSKGYDITTATRRLSSFVKSTSALNLNILALSSDGVKTRVKAYVVGLLGHKAEKDPNLRAYYEPILVRGRGLIGYVSSTVKDYCSTMSGLSFNILNSELVEIDPMTLSYSVVKL